MSISGILFEQTIVIFIIIIIGVICYKTNLIDDATNSKLSSILLMLVNPLLIFMSYQRDLSKDLLGGLLISFLLAIVTHIVAITISYIFLRRKKRKIIIVDGIRIKKYVDNEDVAVERLSSSYANMGFFGLPLVNSIYGSEGVFYVTAYVTVFNILIWTHGVIMMSGSKDLKFKDILKKLMTPTILAIILGLLFFVLQIRIPNVMHQSFGYIANINTPFAMLIAGVSVGKTNIFKLFTQNLRMYYSVFLKLLLIPFALVLLYVWLPIDDMVKMIAIIMAATPTSTIGTLFTIKYNKNSELSAQIFAVTTLLCVITIPIIIKITELLM
jgi:predicted permease